MFQESFDTKAIEMAMAGVAERGRQRRGIEKATEHNIYLYLQFKYK